MEKKAYIQTFGCQMNEHDSFRMVEILKREGYYLTSKSEEADLILLNTCSVRENPENKVYSQLGRIKLQKSKNKNLIIGVGGCVAQQEGENILKREKSVDMVFGTDQYLYLPKMIDEVKQGKRALYTEWMPREKKVQNFIPEEELKTGHVNGCKAYIAITKGCDNFCSFCIVPLTRGREVSRNLDNILLEAENLISKGAKEIMLVGQNVNSYQANGIEFYDLLNAVASLKGLYRLRFTSPHPNDWSSNLSELMASHSTICNQLHLPFQAGSNKILKAMRRGHTVEEYLKKINYLKKIIPDISLSTDLIVGFPGETEEDFLKTIEVLETVKFHQVYAFKYSERPRTRASKMEDDVPQEIKEKRLARILELQSNIQNKCLEHYVGTTQEVLIDSAHPKLRFTMNGRTNTHVPVSILNSNHEIGSLIRVKIMEKKTHSLIGKTI